MMSTSLLGRRGNLCSAATRIATVRSWGSCVRFSGGKGQAVHHVKRHAVICSTDFEIGYSRLGRHATQRLWPCHLSNTVQHQLRNSCDVLLLGAWLGNVGAHFLLRVTSFRRYLPAGCWSPVCGAAVVHLNQNFRDMMVAPELS